ncbi:dynamin family protein [Prosthecochloris sp. SCSIO W1101]|uniref:dynamin family protein n=1 Tax=Prosthecochloris sp. SCSIO W1101 TaxID=2992242 RepID=UPI00223CAA57|nr:dynamin family protein [Prosthecochloris sp. SCSIO W1101]UZJ40280.1 dynamin family protein [Prosthecochloris sp. SCSIO W1101]
MTQLEEMARNCLVSIGNTLHQTPWADEVKSTIKELTAELDKPCVIAVSGQVKAGKSTFVNAFLGMDLAKTGVKETTATLTYFKYGNKEQEKKPLCYWENGKITEESLDFVRNLQGNDKETLKLAAAVSHIEVYVNHPKLRDVTIVDTPGTGSMIDVHEKKAKELSSRYNEQTQRLTRQADAVIYLIGYVGKMNDLEFVAEFKRISGGLARPMNAVGVMAKIDKSDSVLRKRNEFAVKIASGIPELNTVIPVSALLEKSLSEMINVECLEALRNRLLSIPEETRHELLDVREYFDEDQDYEDCPYSAQERKAWRKGIEWKVFQLIAKTLVQYDTEKAVSVLRRYSGFDELRDILELHFFQRSRLLKCYHVISQLSNFLHSIKNDQFFEFEYACNQESKDVERYVAFLDRIEDVGEIRDEIIRYIRKKSGDEQYCVAVQDSLMNALNKVEIVQEELEVCNNDFNALQMLSDNDGFFSNQERIELQNVFGQYGLSLENRTGHVEDVSEQLLKQRQLYWQSKEYSARGNTLTIVEQAVARYSRIYANVRSSELL